MGVDRINAVGYATTLLQTHQLRRENGFLHGQLQSCEKHIETLRDEVQSLINDSQNTKEKLQEILTTTSRHDVELRAQSNNSLRLDTTNEALQKQMSSMTALNKEYRHDQEQLQRQFDEQINVVSRTMQRTTENHESQVRSLTASLRVLTSALEEKADIHVVAKMHEELGRLAAASRSLSPTLSRVLDSVENPPASPELDLFTVVRGQTENMIKDEGVQVRNSQPEDWFRGDQGGQRRKEDGEYRKPPRQSTTIPDDLDLDANAETSSYAGHHHYPRSNETPLAMLPELAADPSELAKINTLHQMRFETWGNYHQRAQRLLENLPLVFGEAIMRQFVDGMCREIQRRQCKQFLETVGWKWDNITTFGVACSQLDTGMRRPEPEWDGDFETAEPVNQVLQSLLTVRKKDVPRKAIRRNVVRNIEPARRSQRLLERAHAHADKGNVDVATQNEQGQRNPTFHEDQLGTRTLDSSMNPADEGVNAEPPKLVSGKRGPSLRVENESDNEVLLPSMKRIRRIVLGVRQIAIDTRAFDQPPPPKIPFMSTTSEE